MSDPRGQSVLAFLEKSDRINSGGFGDRGDAIGLSADHLRLLTLNEEEPLKLCNYRYVSKL